jgi:hypothetical protein
MVPEQPKIITVKGLLSLNALFKCLIVLLACLFLLAFWRESQNGRYALYKADNAFLRLDTRTGEVSIPRVSRQLW